MTFGLAEMIIAVLVSATVAVYYYKHLKGGCNCQ